MKTFLSPKIILCLLLLRFDLFNDSASAATLSVTPSAISNTYTGMITLQLGGLTNGETVLIEKFLDANTNSVIDAGDLLTQSFRVTDGQVDTIGGKTNVNVPGDSDATGGAITTLLNFHRIDLEHLAGSYAFKLSSPSERFTPVTSIFNITNAVYAQSFTGQVRSNGTATVVANALVILLEPNDDGNFIAGAVADNLGNYTINAAPGTYQLAAFKSNFLGDFTVSPVVLGAGVTVTNNVNAVPATRTISGRVADAANTNIPLPGVMMFFDSDEGLVTVGFTDASGNFNVPVTVSGWEVELAEPDVAVHGYLQGDGNYVDTVAGSVSDVNILLPKGTALFYGSIEDDLGNPLPGFAVSGNDQNHQYESDGVSDGNGDYAVAVLAGSWSAYLINDDPHLTNYVFSGGDAGNITLTNGQAVRRDFVLKSATNHITGFLKDNNDTPISGVQIFAYANINGTNYQTAGAITDGSGNYSLNVANGNWSVGVNCCNDCDDGLDSAYQCPNNQNVNIFNDNGVANFTVQSPTVHLGGRVVDTSGDPVGNIQMSVNDQMGSHFSGGTDEDGYFNIGLSAGTWNLQLSGDDAAAFGLVGPSLVFSNLVDGANITDILYVAQNVTAYITGNVHEVNLDPLPFVNIFANATANGTNYNTGGETDGDGNYSIGVFNGTWSVGVDGRDLDGFETPTNQSATVSGSNVTVNFTIVPLEPLQITTTSLPPGVIFQNIHTNLQATGGQPPYDWNIISGSLPPGVIFDTGLIDGIPTNSGTFNFTVEVEDQQGNTADQSLTLTITAGAGQPPTLSSPSKISSSQFQLRLTGVSNQNYTIQYSTTLTNWISFLTNSSPTNSFNIIDPNATNGARFYRALIGP